MFYKVVKANKSPTKNIWVVSEDKVRIGDLLRCPSLDVTCKVTKIKARFKKTADTSYDEIEVMPVIFKNIDFTSR